MLDAGQHERGGVPTANWRNPAKGGVVLPPVAGPPPGIGAREAAVLSGAVGIARKRAASDRLRIGLESFAEDVSTGQVADRRFL